MVYVLVSWTLFRRVLRFKQVCALTGKPALFISPPFANAPGQVAEWLKAADCKSAHASVRWFESSPVHQFPVMARWESEMTIHKLVGEFYTRIWNAGDRSAVEELLSNGFKFRGSLGPEIVGRDRFWEIVTGVRSALSNYHCEILDCVSEGSRAFAKMKFSGRHTATFRGHQPSGLIVAWHGAALFQFEGDRIGELWVLSDTAALDAMLLSNTDKLGRATSV
jgi:predicted ester cyclase